MKIKVYTIILFAVFLAFVSIFSSPSLAKGDVLNQQPSSVPIYGYEVVNVYPHDRAAFTEGLVYDGKTLYESTGRYGESTIRQVNLTTGKIMDRYSLSDELFGEGLTLWKDELVQLTWQSGIGFVYNKSGLEEIGSFGYLREGWGLTNDCHQLIMSDGSDRLYFLNPDTFEDTGSITVKDGGNPVYGLNELEYIKGKVFANIYYSSKIAIISPETGNVTGYIDLQKLVEKEKEYGDIDVLNGIAYEADKDLLLVTGKLWPDLFEIRIKL